MVLDRGVELNDTKFYIIWLLPMSAIFENKNDIKCMGQHWRKWKVAPPILNFFEESGFNQPVSWSKDRKKSVDIGNVQI